MPPSKRKDVEPDDNEYGHVRVPACISRSPLTQVHISQFVSMQTVSPKTTRAKKTKKAKDDELPAMVYETKVTPTCQSESNAKNSAKQTMLAARFHSARTDLALCRLQFPMLTIVTLDVVEEGYDEVPLPIEWEDSDSAVNTITTSKVLTMLNKQGSVVSDDEEDNTGEAESETAVTSISSAKDVVDSPSTPLMKKGLQFVTSPITPMTPTRGAPVMAPLTPLTPKKMPKVPNVILSSLRDGYGPINSMLGSPGRGKARAKAGVPVMDVKYQHELVEWDDLPHLDRLCYV
ncbi:hypothetical protein BDN72DRAFT_865672 [Pluteus cervinus]|uniref:Uncharacterized protein n=1 Tax=Pluteus cervinus TaxID=181527 RepID=A0ACD2ZZ91_9AGAR|nr:hypothetical protein BDN72DRAFT_865672 [Pluteus cervinus]